jgi:hypothetical protein
MSTATGPREEISAIQSADRPHTALWRYLLKARVSVVATAPVLYACLLPFLLLDLFISLYQAVCFRIYGIPKVTRGNFFMFDRGKLPYLNLLERLNCVYCSYANGVLAYVAEIAARTEQYWCPIKHEHDPGKTHSRYPRFLPYGDARDYRARSEELRVAFDDLRVNDDGARVGLPEKVGMAE